MTIAVTGATGFVGGHLLDACAAAGVPVRALTRRPQPAREGVTWVEGALDRPDSLARLVEGTRAVVHVAGVVNAPTQAGFAAGNIAGTEAMLAAASSATVTRFVHVSSLAAREPQLSDYGWSKAEAERRVEASPLAWTIVRPPAVYGPGDTEMLDLFRAARTGVMPMPANGRASLIHAADLAPLLLTLASPDAAPREILEPDDGRAEGWPHAELARAIGTAVGRRVVTLPVPPALLMLGARADRLLRGGKAKLTPDRARYMAHPDWVARHRPDASLWQPAIATPAGLAETAAAYRAKGWLKG